MYETDFVIAWRTVFRALWMDFNTKFKYLIENLSRHRKLLQEQALALHMRSSQAQLLIIDKAIQETISKQDQALLKLEQAEQDRLSVEKARVLAWMGSKNVALDHHDDALKARVENTNSGRWLLQQQNIADWLHDEFPKNALLWLTGMPGAGTSIPLLFRSRKLTADRR